MRAILLLTSFLLIVGCMGEPEQSTSTGDEGIGSSGVDGTGSGGERTQCPEVTVEGAAQLVTNEETNETACSTRA